MATALIPLIVCGCSTPGMDAYLQKDYADAQRQFREKNDPESDFALGVMSYKGQGGVPNPAEAATWFHKAAEKGHAGLVFNNYFKSNYAGSVYFYEEGRSLFIRTNIFYRRLDACSR